MIDQIIKWKPQINHVATKISKSIGVMYILALLLESTTLLLLVISLSQDGMGEELNGRMEESQCILGLKQLNLCRGTMQGRDFS